MIRGIGTDIVNIARIQKILQRYGENFARRILTPDELVIYSQSSRQAVFMAKRFAVKEAAAKALGTGIGRGISWQHISIDHDQLGAPLLLFTDRALELQRQKKSQHRHVSLADEIDHVIAFVVLS